MTSELCPCGSRQSYANCCQPLHQGTHKAATAEQLMRSRYSAFAKQENSYLKRTLHPDKRESDDYSAPDNLQWLGLDILQTDKGSPTDHEGIVEFIAYYDDGNQPGQLHERSRFLQEQQQWYYLDGEFPELSAPSKLPGRNEPCWCHSGKKYKKCHAV
ncbi:MAG: YchJ family metal-binding protein [Pseudomonadales bacterium]